MHLCLVRAVEHFHRQNLSLLSVPLGSIYLFPYDLREKVILFVSPLRCLQVFFQNLNLVIIPFLYHIYNFKIVVSYFLKLHVAFETPAHRQLEISMECYSFHCL